MGMDMKHSLSESGGKPKYS